MEHTLASDNFAPVHPNVMAAIEQANRGYAISYGEDPWTLEATTRFKTLFGSHAEPFFVFNGTAANVCSLKHLLAPWQAVICSESAHIWTDECGAPQAVSGCTLLPVPAQMGKINPEECELLLHAKGQQHNVQPAALSITQSTELGTVYSLKELQALSLFAHRNELLFHMDGARLSNAAASLGLSLKALTSDVDVDVLSFGGTKNGLMGAEAVVFLKKGISANFQYVRKQQMQLASKMRFLSAQMSALLEGDLWRQNAHHANQMAQLLAQQLRLRCPQIPILYPVEANAVFVELPSMQVLQNLQKKSFFWPWDRKRAIARWMTAWDTPPSFIESFVAELEKIL